MIDTDFPTCPEHYIKEISVPHKSIRFRLIEESKRCWEVKVNPETGEANYGSKILDHIFRFRQTLGLDGCVFGSDAILCEGFNKTIKIGDIVECHFEEK